MGWVEKLADWGWQAFMAAIAAALGWFFYIERKLGLLRGTVDALHLHVSENYVKKTDMTALKAEITADLKEIKDGQAQVIDLLLSRKIGTTARRR